MSDTTPEDKWVQWRLACLCPPPSLPLANLLLKVQWSSKLQFLSLPLPLGPVLVFLILFLIFGGIRVPSESLFIERDDHLRTLHIGLLCRHQVSLVRIFPVQAHRRLMTHFKSQTIGAVIQPLMFQFQQVKLCYTAHTNHFMRNMSSPVESVAPIILSGSRPLAKPLSFSVWGSKNKNTT